MTDPTPYDPAAIDTADSFSDGYSATPDTPTVFVCQHRHCRDRGAAVTLATFTDRLPTGTIAVASGCLGQCSSGPTVRVTADETWYCHVMPTDVEAIVTQHLIGGDRVTAKLNSRLHRTFY